MLLAQAQNLIVVLRRARAALDPALRPLRLGAAPRGVARVGAQVPDHRLARLGDAALRPRLHLRRLGLDRLRRDRDRASAARSLDDPLLLIGIALAATGLAFKLSIAPFHQWTPDVYQGAPTPVTAFMAVATKAAVFCVFVRFFDVALGPAVDELAAGARGARGRLDRRRQRRRARPGLAQAAARLLGRRPGRLHAGRRGRRQRGRRQRAGLLPRRLHADEPRRRSR